MIKPEISVLMPVYNASAFLNEAIDSILNQTFGNFELLLINDGSTDSSKEIILAYNDNRIKYIENPSNLGLIKTLNIGLSHCKGEYIARMDADDISHKDRFARQITFLKNNRKYGVVGSHLRIIDFKGNVLSIRKYPVNQAESVSNIVRARHTCVHAAAMYRKEIFEKISGYRDFLHAEDIDLWFRIFSAGIDTINLDEALYDYRQHETQVTSDENYLQKESYRLAFNSFINSISQKPISQYDTNTFLDVVRWKKQSVSRQNYAVINTIFTTILNYRPFEKDCIRLVYKDFQKEYYREKISRIEQIFSKLGILN